MSVAGHTTVISIATGLSETYAVMDGIMSWDVDRPRELIDITAYDDSTTRRRLASFMDLGLNLSGDLDLADDGMLRIKACYRAELPVYVQVLYDGTNGFKSSFLVESIKSDGNVEGKVTMAVSLKADGGMSPVEVPSGGVVPTITLTALPYTRTVAMGSITISGTTTGTPTSITWSASPSGATGTVTGDLTNWSTSVAISPDASGEGVETITFTATNAAGSDTDAVTVGFYVAGAHTWFNAQNINGTYNSGMVNNDAVTTWENLGSSALDVTQGTGSLQPAYRTNMIGGQPVVKGDGGDYMVAATASDWRFLHEDTQNHVYGAAMLISGTTQISVYGTRATSTAAEGVVFYQTISNDRISRLITNASAVNSVVQTPATVAWPEGTQWYDFDNYHDGTAGSLEGKLYINNALIQEASATAAYSSGTGPTSALTIMASSGGNRIGAQEWFTFMIYNGTVLNATQRGINHAVTEWALGGTLPLLP